MGPTLPVLPAQGGALQTLCRASQARSDGASLMGVRGHGVWRHVTAQIIYPTPLSTLCQTLASELDCGSEPARLRRAGTSSETWAEGCTGFLGLP